MAQIIIYAHAATFTDHGNGVSMISYMPFDPPLFREVHELRNVKEIDAKRAEVCAQLMDENPDRGFFVSAMMASRRERCPNGFKKLRRFEYNPAKRAELDAQLEQLVDKAVAELVAAGKIDPARATKRETAEIGGIEFKKVNMGGGCTAFVM